ncbi:MAG: hypothetical protein APR63_13920 [Desulfuromonas sp. SDB]|nr:MAG: hypothetical protein APR63_13920 [Desulfuromonas sp. SDB]
MIIYEEVYWNLERIFCDIIDKYFGIEHWLENEMHASDIWAQKGFFKDKSKEDVKLFFNEFIQLLSKLDIPFILSIQPKIYTESTKEKNIAYAKCSYSLLQTIEFKLAQRHQTGILIVDDTQDCKNITIVDSLNLDYQKESLSVSQTLFRQFFALTSWRSLKNYNDFNIIKPKFIEESKSIYMLDRIHFLSSKDSLFLQMCDIVLFIIQRCLTNDYLFRIDRSRIDPDKIPISKYSISTFRSNLSLTYYDSDKNDFTRSNIVRTGLDDILLIEFRAYEYLENKLSDIENSMRK